jgi:hypothetical protein
MESTMAADSGPLMESGLHLVSLARIRKIFRFHGVTEAYYLDDAMIEGNINLTISNAIVVRLQDGAFWCLLFPEKNFVFSSVNPKGYSPLWKEQNKGK